MPSAGELVVVVLHQLRYLYRSLNMRTHLAKRHIQKDFGVLVIPARKPVAVENQIILVAC